MTPRPVRGPVVARRPFFVKIALVLASATALCLVGLGFVVIDANEATLRALAESRQHLALEDVARSLDDELRQHEDALESVGRAIVATPDEEAEHVVTLVTALVSGQSELTVVGLYAADGERIDVVREASAESALPDRLDDELRARAAERGSATSAVSDEGTLLSVVPLRASSGLSGFVATELSLAPLAARITALSTRHFPDVEDPIVVADEAGRIVLRSELGAPRPAPATLTPGLTVARAGSYAEVVERFTLDAQGASSPSPRLVTMERAETRPFFVIVSEPTRVVFASLSALRVDIAIAVGIAIALSCALSFLLARRLTRPVAALVAQADHLAHRRFDQRVDVRSGDELELLGDALSHAAGELEASEARIQREMAIRHDLGRYLPREVVDRVVRREQDMELGGTRRPISVLFADVVGFTPLTERLAPEQTVKLLNELFTLLTEIVFRHGGTLDKFMGDSVMAIFGAPGDQADHAARAVACAEDMLRFLDTGNAGWSERYGVKLELAIGVSSGECVVGNIGSESRMEYTAIGDVVNVAARLEAIARPNQILLTRATADAAGDGFDWVDRGPRELPGKKEAVRLLEVVVG